MIRQKHIFLLAVACSLALHLASYGVYVEYARLRGTGRFSVRRTSAPAATTMPADELIVYPEMGDDQGTGIGSNSSPGPEPMQAREADEDQALLSRNPQGIGRVDLPPSPQRGPLGDGKGGQPTINPEKAVPAVAGMTPPPPEAKSTPPIAVAVHPAPTQDTPPPARVQVASAPPSPSALTGQSDPEIKPETVDPPARPAPAVKPQTEEQATKAVQQLTAEQQAKQTVTFAKPQAADGDGKRRGAPPSAGNPLPQSESDSDPFSRISGNITVPRVGRLDPRLGRKVKTTRPQVNIAGEIDLFALNNPTVVLEVHVAPTGKVTDVKIAHSSGSNSIDEPTRVAVYDWWFEPAKDKNGKPISDVTFFTVEFL